MIDAILVEDLFIMQRLQNEAATIIASGYSNDTALSSSLRDQPHSGASDSRRTDNTSDTTNSSLSTSPDSNSSKQDCRVSKPAKKANARAPRNDDRQTASCKSQHPAYHRSSLPNCLRKAQRHGPLRAEIPLDRKHRAVMRAPSPRAGCFVIKGTYPRAYQTFEYGRRSAQKVVRDVEAQRSGRWSRLMVADEEVEEMMRDDCCFYWTLFWARVCLMGLVMVVVVGFVLLVVVVLMGQIQG